MQTTYRTHFPFHRVTLDIKKGTTRQITPLVWYPYGEVI